MMFNARHVEVRVMRQWHNVQATAGKSPDLLEAGHLLKLVGCLRLQVGLQCIEQALLGPELGLELGHFGAELSVE
jgi:hypothetical protein